MRVRSGGGGRYWIAAERRALKEHPLRRINQPADAAPKEPSLPFDQISSPRCKLIDEFDSLLIAWKVVCQFEFTFLRQSVHGCKELPILAISAGSPSDGGQGNPEWRRASVCPVNYIDWHRQRAFATVAEARRAERWR